MKPLFTQPCTSSTTGAGTTHNRNQPSMRTCTDVPTVIRRRTRKGKHVGEARLPAGAHRHAQFLAAAGANDAAASHDKHSDESPAAERKRWRLILT